MFQKTKPSRIYQDLVVQIENAIIEGKLKAGDKLPSQRHLGEMFQTGRGPLREALRVLELKGLIEIKLGVSGGAIVKDVNTKPVSESLGMLIRHRKISINEIAEFREGVEGNVAALAASRATQCDIKRLKEILSEAETLLSGGEENGKENDRVDRMLHMTLAKIAGNEVYTTVLRMVHDNLDPYYEQMPLKDTSILRQSHEDHKELVSAIEAGLGSEARILVQNHVRKFNNYMIREAAKADL